MEKNIHLVFNECLKICKLLDKHFHLRKLSFIRAERYQIEFCLDDIILVFRYPPERYEDQSIMWFKGLAIKPSSGSQRAYPVSQVLSFHSYQCNDFDTSVIYKTLEESIQALAVLLPYLQSEEMKNWEEKYERILSNKNSIYRHTSTTGT